MKGAMLARPGAGFDKNILFCTLAVPS
jgi:hypothetical protein